MKRRILSALLVCVLMASLVAVAAAGGAAPSASGFIDVKVTAGFEDSVTVTPLTASGEEIADDGTGFYADAVKLQVTSKATNGKFYLIAALTDDGVPTEENIQYINQDSGKSGKVSFSVYPKELLSGQTYSICLSSNGSDYTELTKVAEFTYHVPYKLGDVNDDGSINALDALAALQHSVGSAMLEGDRFLAADVDRNDTVNALDALLILQYSVGKVTEF